MELKDFKIEMLQEPVIDEVVTHEGVPCTGDFTVGDYLLSFYNGKLCDFKGDDNGIMRGQTFPAVQGPGHMEYRVSGILNNPDDITPARSTEGFSKREYWQMGKFIKEEIINRDDEE